MEAYDQHREAHAGRPETGEAGTDARDRTPSPRPTPAATHEAASASDRGPDSAAADPDPLPDFGAYEAKARAAWKALGNRYGARLSQVEIDHLHARFVMGLTTPGFGEGPSAVHLRACAGLLALDLPPHRVEAALEHVPPDAEEWVEAAFVSIEDHGERIGREISNGHGRGAATDGGSSVAR